jgi:hypothetical protein
MRTAWGLAAAIVAAMAQGAAGAQGSAVENSSPCPSTREPGVAKGFHPPVVFLDGEGQSVLKSGRPISTLTTCGQCHDTHYIATHNDHASPGRDEQASPATAAGWRTGDYHRGPFARRNLLFPAEVDCFLCHMSKPDNAARCEEGQDGRLQWSATATLSATGLVQKTAAGWSYAREAFDERGAVAAGRLGLGPPSSENCGQCHGMVWQGRQPLRLELSPAEWSTATEGQVFSSQRMSDSAANLRGKRRLARPWDVHAERLLECTSCHFSLNNPSQRRPSGNEAPGHLVYDPRRQSLGEYLRRPSHQLAQEHSAPSVAARHLESGLRRCGDCHEASRAHDWLPYREAHFQHLSCEACHVPAAPAPAIRQIDWTLLSPAGQPRIEWRGLEGQPGDPAAEVTGFQPVLLPRRDLDGRERLVPMNLLSAWYWVEDGPSPRPVRLADLEAALFSGGAYRPEVAAVLDVNGDGRVEQAEQVLDSAEKVEVVRRRLLAVGVRDPRIEAEVEPYELHHGVAAGRWATRSCEDCHAARSRLAARFELASYAPGGVLPKIVGSGGATLTGRVEFGDRGSLVFRPETRRAGLYVLGHDHWPWVNILGGLALVGVVLTVGTHAGLRMRNRHRCRSC